MLWHRSKVRSLPLIFPICKHRIWQGDVILDISVHTGKTTIESTYRKTSVRRFAYTGTHTPYTNVPTIALYTWEAFQIPTLFKISINLIIYFCFIHDWLHTLQQSASSLSLWDSPWIFFLHHGYLLHKTAQIIYITLTVKCQLLAPYASITMYCLMSQTYRTNGDTGRTSLHLAYLTVHFALRFRGCLEFLVCRRDEDNTVCLFSNRSSLRWQYIVKLWFYKFTS